MNIQNTNTVKRRKKVLLWIVIGFSVLIMGALTFVGIKSKEIIYNQLTQLVYEKSDSIYTLDYNDLQISLFQKQVSVSHVNFQPHITQLKDSSHSLYTLKTDLLHLQGIKFKPLIMESRFVAEKFEISSPTLELSSGEHVEMNALTSNQVQVGDTIQIPFFTEIFFDTLQVTNAQLNIDTLFQSNYELPEINLVATHFKIGGRKFTETHYPFDVSDLSLSIDNFKENLADSLHKISINKISLSLLNSTIKANQVLLEPISDTISSFENKYRIEVPELKVNSNILNTQLQIDTISINKVEFINPLIDINFGSRVRKGTPINEIDFYKLIGNNTQWIKVSHFKVNNARVRLVPPTENKVAQEFEQLFINFYNFQIDSTSYQNPSRILSAENINFSLGKFKLYHTDNIHQLVINNLKVDSRTNRIGTGSLRFKPIGKDATSSTLIDIESEGLVFKDINFLDFYHDQRLPMDQLIIKSPNIDINYQYRKTVTRNKQDKSLILEKTQDYLKGIYVNSTQINDAKIKYNYRTIQEKEGFFNTNFSLDLSNLSVDSATFYQSDKIFFADNFNVKFDQINLQLSDDSHRLKSKSIELSSKTRSAEIIDLKILPMQLDLNDSVNFLNKTENYDIHFPKIKLSGANLHQAFFNKKLYIQHFNVYRPTFNIEKYGKWANENDSSTPYQNAIYSLISDFIYDVNIRNLNIEDGTLNLSQHKQSLPKFELSNQFTVRLKHFEINNNSLNDKSKLLFSDDIDLILKDQSFSFADGVHKLTADEIGILSSEKRVYLKDAHLYPDILSESFKELPISVFATIPDLEVSRVNIFNLFNNGKLPVNQMTFTKPEIRLLFQDVDSKNKNTDQPLLLLEELKTLSANKINIIDGYLELSKYIDHKTKVFANTNINFTINDFRINQNQGEFKSSYSNFAFDLDYFRYNLPDETHTLTVGSANYQLRKKKFNLEHLNLRPLSHIDQDEKNQFYSINIPQIELSDLDLKEYLYSKKLVSNTLSIKSPSVKITDNRIENQTQFSPYKLDFYNSIKPFAQSIEVENINFSDGHLELKNNKNFKLNNISFNSSHFVIDKDFSQKGKLLNSDKVDITFEKLRGTTSDEFFEYRIKELKINEKGNFVISDFDLKPLHTQQEFARLKRYQADYFDVEKANIIGKGLNIQEIFENKALHLLDATIEAKTFSIHRDKTFPLSDVKKKLPQESLRDSKYDIYINQVNVAIDHFKYTEIEPKATKTSYVFVDNGQATIQNITNIRQRLEYNPILKAAITGNLMGEATSKINMDFNVKSLDNEFTFNAHIDKVPLSIFNPITEPGLKLSIKEGISQSLNVYFVANEDSAIGTMRFAYNDLKVGILSQRGNEIKEGKLVSFLVNNVALKTDNPKPGRIIIPAKFENHREKNRAVVGYCWRSIFAGIKSTLGLKEKEK